MKESFDLAVQELKRVDHLFWVSLKYTRTVDVIKHVIDRIINCMSYGFESILKYAQEKKLVSSIPENAGLRCDLLKSTFPENAQLMNYINIYTKLRKLSKAEYTRREEFRRHVTMIATIDKGEVVEVCIDTLREDYEMLKIFLTFVKRMINEEKEEQ
ncbi:MAG: hypothetical protein AABX00_02850 [Nanoarchaeota archaeon]